MIVAAALVSGLCAGAGGFLVGFAFGSTSGERKTYNLAVRDGRDILAELKRGAIVVRGVQERLVKMDEGLVPIDKAGVEAVTATPRPFPAGVFARRRYLAFRPQTVDQLFLYYTETVFTWVQFGHLAKDSANPEAAGGASRSIKRLRAELDELVKTQTELIRQLEEVAALPESKVPF